MVYIGFIEAGLYEPNVYVEASMCNLLVYKLTS